MPDLNESFGVYLKNLDVPPDMVEFFSKAKTTVGDYLAAELNAFVASEAGGSLKVTPRFFVQGSWAYRTLNLPDQAPPQDMDVDLGVYLPVSYKAWRDRLWKSGGPSSIFMMVLSAQAFKEVVDRDDLAFLEILHQMPKALLAPVIIPNYNGEDLSESQKPEDLKKLGEEAFRFYHDLSTAIHSVGEFGPAQQIITGHLGPRFPGLRASEKKRD